jgi:multicomponent Na+:H+ antiporter subunit A
MTLRSSSRDLLADLEPEGHPGRGSHQQHRGVDHPDQGLQHGLTFYVDGLSLTFALLITGIGPLVIVYAGGYLAGHAHLGRFYVSLLTFTISMLGIVVADNVIVLFVFWELTSLSSYLLIGFEHEDETARAAALQALLVTGAGGLALLAGLLMLGLVAGTLELSVLVAHGDVVRAQPAYLPILLLVLVGACTSASLGSPRAPCSSARSSSSPGPWEPT